MRLTRASARWLGDLPIALLVCVALSQLVLAQRADLSPWSGGGFGMFSTTDAGSRRHLHVFVLRPGLERELPIPLVLEELARRARVLPSEANLRALALEMVHVPTPDPGPATAVRIKLWRTRFDPETLVPSSHILRSLEFSLEDAE